MNICDLINNDIVTLRDGRMFIVRLKWNGNDDDWTLIPLTKKALEGKVDRGSYMSSDMYQTNLKSHLDSAFDIISVQRNINN